jgi:hypothetical protein
MHRPAARCLSFSRLIHRLAQHNTTQRMHDIVTVDSRLTVHTTLQPSQHTASITPKLMMSLDKRVGS